jgi:hypothetical protein
MRVVIAILMLVSAAAAGEIAKPPPEIADMLKSVGGAWKCEGTLGNEKVKLTGTTKSELDGFWIHDTMAFGRYKRETFTTWDVPSKKWRRVAITNDGGQMVGTGEPMKDMKMDFNLDTASGLFRDHVDASDLKKGAHLWGEQSLDKGKTWTPVYDLTCRR